VFGEVRENVLGFGWPTFLLFRFKVTLNSTNKFIDISNAKLWNVVLPDFELLQPIPLKLSQSSVSERIDRVGANKRFVLYKLKQKIIIQF